MRILKISTKKAQYFAIDLLFSALLVFAALIVIYSYSLPTYTGSYEENLQRIGENALMALAEEGALHNFVYGGQWQELYLALRELLPKHVHFAFEIWTYSGGTWSQSLPPYPYSPPTTAYVVKVVYVLSGDYNDATGTFDTDPKRIELLLWE
ncbi:MAG: hypothetical protein ACTSXX_07530 [Candidatus Baldrarchaeia archaeon]